MLVLVLCLYLCCACSIAQCILCLYPLYSVLAWPARAMYLLTRVCPRTVHVLLHSVYCACTPCTVFGIAITGNVSILPVFILVLWLYHCTVCTVLVPLVQCSGMASTDSVSILPMFVLVLCVYHYTVCTVLVPLVQCSGMASPGNVPTYPHLSSYCACAIEECVLCVYPLYSGLAWPARALYLFSTCLNSYCGCIIAQCALCSYLLYSVLAWPARVMYLSYPCLYSVVPLHSVCCVCTPCAVFWYGQPGRCTYPLVWTRTLYL